MSREFVMVVRESSFGTPVASPVLGTDRCYLRMSEMPNGFVGDMASQQIEIMFGGGRAIPAERVSDLQVCTGRLTTLMYPGVWSRILLPWALQPINAGRTLPWVTTQTDGELPIEDLASISLYHAYLQSDGIYRRKRYAGCKAMEGSITVGDTGDARRAILDVGWQGIRQVGNPIDASSDPNAAEFPAPAQTDYPFGPYLFSHLGNVGVFNVGGAITRFAGLTIRFRNVMAPRAYESRFLQTNCCRGRSITFDIVLRERVTPNWESIFQQLTLQGADFEFDNGSAQVRFNLNARNIVTAHTRQFAMGGEFMRQLSLSTMWDPAQATDLTLTVS